jgi:predicted nucleic acid-binding protein
MILVDTCVCIDHLRGGDIAMVTLLKAGRVLVHPFIVGELACANLNNRTEVLMPLRGLPPAPLASDEEALRFIAQQDLMGRGVGYIDVHLLASVALAWTARLWTWDKRLSQVADTLIMAFKEGR